MRIGILAAVLAASVLAAGPAGAASNILAWDFPVAEEANITTFNIERKTQACAGSTGVFNEIGTVAKTLRTFTDSAVVPGSTYCYRARTVGPGGASGYSNTAEKILPFPVPAAPSNLTVTTGP